MRVCRLIRTLGLLTGAIVALSASVVANAAAENAGVSGILIRDFVPKQGICRAMRPIDVSAVMENKSESEITVQPRFVLPDGVRLLHSDAGKTVRLKAFESRRMSWRIEALKPADYIFKLELLSNGNVICGSNLDMRFFEVLPIKKLPYIPEPKPVKTTILVGAHNCPLWEADKPELWAQVRKHPERTPALGFYSQENPQVADWETKWAVEHGVSYFVYCWYRASQGEPVKMNFGSAIQDALLKSRFVDKMKFTIMWTNYEQGITGVSDEKDLMTNLMPFWIDNYFKHPSYLKIDNKPVLFVYQPGSLVQDLGSVENVRQAFDKMRQACKDAGFDGLYLLGEFRGHETAGLQYLKQLGLDYVFAYCWYIADNPTPDQAVKTQMDYIKQTRDFGFLPEVVTVSQAWSGWRDEGTIWKIPPTQFEGLLRQAKDYISTIPANELGSKMLLLDNWNEWSEGHYIAPYREYGFEYLDAVRKVFSNAPEKHDDLIPEDIGFGPYDRAYTKWSESQEKLHGLLVKKVSKAGAKEPGLVAWWAFDEAKDSLVALDYSGHRLGGILSKTGRTKGIDGNALDCRGGCVFIPGNGMLSVTNGLTIECWVRTDVADQKSAWLVNRVYGVKPNTGYRLGIMEGKPCFGVPQTEWSHHLKASNALSTGRWVHLAGTFDGKIMRIYVDGQECGSMDRPGPLNPNDFRVCLGNFAENHDAHFTGLLDEIKLYDRALSASEVRAHMRFR